MSSTVGVRQRIRQKIRRYTPAWLKRWFTEKYRSNLLFGVFAVLALIVVVNLLRYLLSWTEDMYYGNLAHFDDAVASFFIEARSPALTSFMKFVTMFGTLKGYLILTVIFTLVAYFRWRYWRAAIEIVLFLAASAVINKYFKRYIARERPHEGLRLVEASAESFPSGHAQTAMTYFGFVIFYAIFYVKSPRWRAAVTVFCISMIILIGISRIYLGVHYPTDVVAGYITGGIFVIVGVLLIKTLEFVQQAVKSRRAKQLRTATQADND